MERDAMLGTYTDYIDACNRRDWERLGTFVADRVLVNGRSRTRDEYIADIRATVAVFPDYVWEIRRVIVEGAWLSVHLHDVGTRRRAFLGAPGDGLEVDTDEFAMYRFLHGRIEELEGTADDARLQRTGTRSAPDGPASVI